MLQFVLLSIDDDVIYTEKGPTFRREILTSPKTRDLILF